MKNYQSFAAPDNTTPRRTLFFLLSLFICLPLLTNPVQAEEAFVPGEAVIHFKPVESSAEAGMTLSQILNERQAFLLALENCDVPLDASGARAVNQTFLNAMTKAGETKETLMQQFYAALPKYARQHTSEETFLAAAPSVSVRMLVFSLEDKSPEGTMDAINRLRNSEGCLLGFHITNTYPIPLGSLSEANYLEFSPNLPNDTCFLPTQWGLHYDQGGELGDGNPLGCGSYKPAGTPGVDIDAPEAWEIETGSPDVVVAVIDSGIDLDHPDLRNKIAPGSRNFVDGRDPHDVQDIYGHGSHVAGIIAAETNNFYGIAGVCPDCSLVALKVAHDGPSVTLTDVIEALNYAWMTLNPPPYVINMSLNFDLGNCEGDPPGPCRDLHQPITAAHNMGIMLVASAGNDNTDLPSYPAAYPEVMSVGATNNNDERISISNYGPYVDLAGPGKDIWSTFSNINFPKNLFAYWSGTSFAAAHASGLAALIYSYTLPRDPFFSPEEVKEVIMGSTDSNPHFEGGRLNAGEALYHLTCRSSQSPWPALMWCISDVAPEQLPEDIIS